MINIPLNKRWPVVVDFPASTCPTTTTPTWGLLISDVGTSSIDLVKCADYGYGLLWVEISIFCYTATRRTDRNINSFNNSLLISYINKVLNATNFLQCVCSKKSIYDYYILSNYT